MEMVICPECQMGIPKLAKKCHHCLSPTTPTSPIPAKTEVSSNALSTALANTDAFVRLVLLALAVPAMFAIVIGLALWWIVPLVKNSLGPSSIEITPQGAIKLSGSGKTSAAFLLSPHGGEQSPWIDTGIDVKAGQTLKVVASGRINIAAHRLVEFAERDLPPPAVWIGPQGDDGSRAKTPREIDGYRNEYVIAKGAPRGRIIGAIGLDKSRLPTKPSTFITDEKIKEDFFDVWANRNGYIAKTSGHLWLTINEIWLGEDNKDAFLPTDKDEHKFDRYYILWCKNAMIQDYAERLQNSRDKVSLEELKQKEQLIQKVRDAIFTGSKLDHADVVEAAKIARDIKASIWENVISPSPKEQRLVLRQFGFED